jgi:glycosyltransferase involved in cell wall biosynthesis
VRVLFVSAFSSREFWAYHQRLTNLKEGLKQLNVPTGMLCIGDYFIKLPTLLKAVNIPLIKKEFGNYDVIHAGASSACYVMGLAKKLGHYKLIQDVHGCIEELLLLGGTLDFHRDYSYLQELILEKISNITSDLFITCSKPLKDRLLQKGIDKDIIEVIRNGVDTELFKPKDCLSNGKEFVVTYAGSFQKWQGIENLLAAAKLITDADLKFRIIGFTNEDSPLKNKIRHALKGQAELIDSLNQTELVNQLCSSDVLIIPRNRSIATQMAFPTKFAEYLAVGKPVITTNVDETSNFVRGYGCGFVCEPSAEAIAQTIMKAKKLPQEALRHMGKNGRQLAELKFDRKVIARQYLEFLQNKLPE